MTTSNFKAALQAAGLTPEQFAEIVEVDPKTVRRWTAGRVPYPRHRAAIARALDSTEHDLWPEDVPAAYAHAPVPGRDAAGAAHDVVGSWGAAWGAADDPGGPVAVEFVLAAGGSAVVLDADRLLHDPEMIQALIALAGDGHEVRVLDGDPRREHARLLGREHLELRIAQLAGDASLIRAGDRMLATLAVPGDLGQARPLLELRRHTNGGLFDRFMDAFNGAWDLADAVVSTPEQLEKYLEDLDEELRDWEADGEDDAERRAPGAGEDRTDGVAPGPGAAAECRPNSGRLWPRPRG